MNAIIGQTGQTSDGYVVAMLWVFVLMAAIPLAKIGGKMEMNRLRRRIGIEMELITNYHARRGGGHSLAFWMTTHGIETYAEGYNHETRTHTKIVPDGSLNDGGQEVVSPPLYDGEDIGWVKRVCKALVGIMFPDRSTGLHTHHGFKDHDDMREITPSEEAIAGRTVAAYAYFEPARDSIVSASRRDSRWCKHMASSMGISENNTNFGNPITYIDDPDQKGRRVKKVLDNDEYEHQCIGWYRRMRNDRYYKVNLTVLHGRGTIEFRQHQGTNNPVKIQNWVELNHLHIVRSIDPQSTRDLDLYERNLDGYFAWLGLADDAPLVTYYQRRKRALAGNLHVAEGWDEDLFGPLLPEMTACSTCGGSSCDADDWCGKATATSEISTKAKEHFDNWELEECDWDEVHCDECGECGCCNATEREPNGQAYCTACDSYTHFSMLGGVVLSVLTTGMTTLTVILLLIGCGIGAFHAGGRKFNMRKATKKMWISLQARGRQASGMAFINRDGNDPNTGEPTKGSNVWVVKSPIPAEALSGRVKEFLNESTLLAFLHTRAATHGANDQTNAHPHRSPQTGSVTLVHNGVIWNHDTVFKKLGVKPATDCDTEAAAACIEDGGIEKVVELCEGSMSLIWTDRTQPFGTLNCWTNGGSPLVMARLDDANGPVVLASTDANMDASVKNRIHSTWDAKLGKHYVIHPDGSITGEMIAGSLLTDRGGFRWYDYTTSYSTSGRFLEGGKVSPANDDDDIEDSGECSPFFGDRLEDALFASVEQMDQWGGFPQQGPYHGFDALNWHGLRPDGTAYQVPPTVDPSIDLEATKSLLCGDYDPQLGETIEVSVDDLQDAKYGEFDFPPNMKVFGYNADTDWS